MKSGAGAGAGHGYLAAQRQPCSVGLTSGPLASVGDTPSAHAVD